jgi:hypothetical protein
MRDRHVMPVAFEIPSHHIPDDGVVVGNQDPAHTTAH